MPTLRQPPPPPGIPAGIPPMRKATAPPSQVPCKHFAQGNCSKGDICEFAHKPKQQGRNASTRSAPRATPPVRLVPLSLLPLSSLSQFWLHHHNQHCQNASLPGCTPVHQCLAMMLQCVIVNCVAQVNSEQNALETQDVPRTNLAHHELESTSIILYTWPSERLGRCTN